MQLLKSLIILIVGFVLLIKAAGTPEDIMASEQSITEKYLKTERG